MKKFFVFFSFLFLCYTPSQSFANVATIEQYFQTSWGVSLDNIYWGDLHTHSSASFDAAVIDALNPEQALAHARDIEKMDFAVLTDHADQPNFSLYPGSSDTLWSNLLKTFRKFNAEQKFIVFPAWEYTNTYGLRAVKMGSYRAYGHKHVVLKDLNIEPSVVKRIGAWPLNWEFKNQSNLRPSYVQKDATRRLAEDYVYATTAKDLWNGLSPLKGTAMTFIHTPCMVGQGESNLDPNDHRTDWRSLNENFNRHVEINSKWGSCEGYPHPDLTASNPELKDAAANTDFDHTEDSLGIRRQIYEGWVKKGNPNFILGFTGGTDTHTGKPGYGGEEHAFNIFSGSITGIVARTLDRNELWKGLWERRTITGLNSKMDKFVAGSPRTGILFALQSGSNHYFMGDLGKHQGLVNTSILAGEKTKKIELLLNGIVIKSIAGRAAQFEIPLSMTENNGRHFLYVRAWDEQGNLLAYSSPIYLQR